VLTRRAISESAYSCSWAREAVHVDGLDRSGWDLKANPGCSRPAHQATSIDLWRMPGSPSEQRNPRGEQRTRLESRLTLSYPSQPGLRLAPVRDRPAFQFWRQVPFAVRLVFHRHSGSTNWVFRSAAMSDWMPTTTNGAHRPVGPMRARHFGLRADVEVTGARKGFFGSVRRERTLASTVLASSWAALSRETAGRPQQFSCQRA
jgi:hypothetical protein